MVHGRDATPGQALAGFVDDALERPLRQRLVRLVHEDGGRGGPGCDRAPGRGRSRPRRCRPSRRRARAVRPSSTCEVMAVAEARSLGCMWSRAAAVQVGARRGRSRPGGWRRSWRLQKCPAARCPSRGRGRAAWRRHVVLRCAGERLPSREAARELGREGRGKRAAGAVRVAAGHVAAPISSDSWLASTSRSTNPARPGGRP